MNSMLETITVISLIILALMAVQTGKLRRAAVYLGAFSLVCSLSYLLYNAPDVAIAEAVIGCTLSTILLLIALKKYHVITIFYVEDAGHDPVQIREERRDLVASLEQFFLKKGFEPQTIPTRLDDAELNENAHFDLLIMHDRAGINIFSGGLRYLSPEIDEYLKVHKPPHLDVDFHCMDDGQGGTL